MWYDVNACFINIYEGIVKVNIQESETGKNLRRAFEFAAKRRMEYDIYALNAERHGDMELSRLLGMFAKMEKEH